MKQFSLLLYLTLVISCNQELKTKSDTALKPDKGRYATKLIDAGFLKFADSSKLDGLKNKLRDSFDIYDEDNFKMVHIDAEELAEFSFDVFLPALKKMLIKRNLTLSVRKLNESEHPFEVLINDDTIQLYTQNDLNNNTFWDRAPRNFFKKVNELLRAKNNTEQFYLLYDGNDLSTLLLTGLEFSIISDYYKDDNKERPYKP